jgi:hypothetical protein
VKDRIEFVLRAYRDEEGGVRWPAAAEERNALASRLLGACTVASLDYWLELALDVVRNPEPSAERRRDRVDPDRDDLERKVLSGLSDEQRAVVERLMFRTAKGAVFSLLTHLDQFPSAQLDLVAFDPDSDVELASVRDGEIFDLHDRLHGWVGEFSEYPHELGTA